MAADVSAVDVRLGVTTPRILRPKTIYRRTKSRRGQPSRVVCEDRAALPMSCFYVFQALGRLSDRTGRCDAPLRTIAQTARLSESQARRALQTLRRVRLIYIDTNRTDENGATLPNRYVLRPFWAVFLKLRNALDKRFRDWFEASYPQRGVSPVPRTPYEGASENTLPEPIPKDWRLLQTPGSIMGFIRRSANAGPDDRPTLSAAIVASIGRLVFSSATAGYLIARPSTVGIVCSALRNGSYGENPPPADADPRRIYAYASAFVRDLVRGPRPAKRSNDGQSLARTGSDRGSGYYVRTRTIDDRLRRVEDYNFGGAG